MSDDLAKAVERLRDQFRLHKPGLMQFGPDGAEQLSADVRAILDALATRSADRAGETTMDAFNLGRFLYEARIREAWNFGDRGERRLDAHPYPSHPADADPRCQSAEVELAQAQAKALLKAHAVESRP